MHELQPLKNKLDALIANLSPQAQKQLARNIGKQIAQSQRQRITRQQNIDGSAYAPRKIQAKSKKGGIKRRAMFAKMKTAKHLKTKTTVQGVEIGFTGNTARIARVHQFGLVDKVDKAGKIKAKFAQRQLLGFSKQDIETVENFVLAGLSGKK
jgi:phage virion morphogenesis protein